MSSLRLSILTPRADGGAEAHEVPVSMLHVKRGIEIEPRRDAARRRFAEVACYADSVSQSAIA